MENKKTPDLKTAANEIRQDIIEMLVEAGSGHSAGSLGMTDVFTALYLGGVLKHDPEKPDWEERDRVILSNGHICPVLYAAMSKAGYFPREELKTLRKFGSRLQGHPHRLSLPGLDSSTGSLGQGLSVACGLALAFKQDQKRNWVWCLTGDGEQDEGQIWEAAMFAGAKRLFNLTQIIDRNNIQIDGHTEDVMPLESLKEKYESFGWHVMEVDGHDIDEIIHVLNESKKIFEKPTVVIAHTIPGYGVDFMEWKPEWHGKTPCPEEGKNALAQIRNLCGKITPENE